MVYKDMFGEEQKGVVVYCPHFLKDVMVWFNDSGKRNENEKKLWDFNGCDHRGICKECDGCRERAVRAAWENSSEDLP